MPLLEIRDLSKTFTMHCFGRRKLVGCHGVTLSVEAGQFVGITGKSGAGKSTVLKCIYRTYLPTSGCVLFDSLQLGRVDLACAHEQAVVSLRRGELGYVSQFLRVLPRVTAFEIVAQAAVQSGISQGDAMDAAASILRWLELDEKLWDAYPTTFSGGEKLRLNIAKSVVMRPRLLLLDEPTASLDEHSKGLVRVLLERLKESGTTMLGIFHDLDFMSAVADAEYSMTSGSLGTSGDCMGVA